MNIFYLSFSVKARKVCGRVNVY